MEKKRVVVFGGSFNPPGLHHRALAEELTRRFDEVVILPCGLRPDKETINLVSARDRELMVNMTFGDIPGVTVDFSDVLNGEFARTYDIDKKMKAKYGDNVWHAVGMDLIQGGAKERSEIQARWEHGKELWRDAKFVVMPRGNEVYDSADLPPHCELINLEINGSSTEIRRRIVAGESINLLVAPSVAEYIYKDRLYQPTAKPQGGLNMPYKLTQEQIEAAVWNSSKALADYCRYNNIHYVVVGSSGGLDSAVTLALAGIACKHAKNDGFRLTSVGLILPCESDPKAEELGREAIKKFGAEEIKLDLTCAFAVLAGKYAISRSAVLPDAERQIKNLLERTNGDEALRVFDESKKVAQGNIKARMRMMLGTYHVARMLKGIVLSTDNLSEYWMAFWTICGDVGDFAMIQKMMKGLELYDIARYLGVPQAIIDAKPDDGLGVSGGDEDQLGANYSTIDKVMIRLIQQGFNPDGECVQLDNLPAVEGIAPELVKSLAQRALNGAYKRHGTIILNRKTLGLPAIQEIKI